MHARRACVWVTKRAKKETTLTLLVGQRSPQEMLVQARRAPLSLAKPLARRSKLRAFKGVARAAGLPRSEGICWFSLQRGAARSSWSAAIEVMARPWRACVSLSPSRAVALGKSSPRRRTSSSVAWHGDGRSVSVVVRRVIGCSLVFESEGLERCWWWCDQVMGFWWGRAHPAELRRIERSARDVLLRLLLFFCSTSTGFFFLFVHVRGVWYVSALQRV